MRNSPSTHTNFLNIHLFEDGFSFCSSDESRFFSAEAFTLNATDSWEEAWRQFGTYEPEDIQLILCNCSAVSVPAPHFDPQLLETYLTTAVEKPLGGIPTFDDAQKSAQISTFYVESAVVNPIKKIFPSLQAKHLNSLLMEYIEPLNRVQSQKRLYVHLRDGWVELILCHGGLLWLINRFPQDSAERFLYYLFYVVEQFELKPDQFEIVFLGRFTAYTSYYEGALDYHKQVDWVEVNHNISGLETHPAPFLATKPL
ncbi:MAG: DUF3822 family protein [Flavobacteriaceae bacterium]